MSEPVDWALAERVAVRVASNRPGPPWDPRSTTRSVRAAAAGAEPVIERFTGLRSAHGAAKVEVVGRAQWARLNVRTFRRLLAPLADELAPKLRGPAGGLTRRIGAVELGTLLGWLSQRVLGQYDLLLAGDGADDDAGDVVYIVGPNVVGLEQRFGFPPDEFRMWVMLHELTHRAQFTGVPWMHDHYLALVGDALSLSEFDPGHVARVARESMQNRAAARAAIAEGGLAALLATPRQRPALASISALMALLEGHGDYTMNLAGDDLVPNASRFANVLAARRDSAGGLARRLQRLVGLEAKLNQYATGRRFVEAVEAALGPRGVDLCWAEPGNLPTLDEIRLPTTWTARIRVATSTASVGA